MADVAPDFTRNPTEFGRTRQNYCQVLVQKFLGEPSRGLSSRSTGRFGPLVGCNWASEQSRLQLFRCEPNVGRSWPNLANISANVWPMLANIDQSLAKTGHFWSRRVRLAPTSANTRPKSSRIRRVWAKPWPQRRFGKYWTTSELARISWCNLSSRMTSNCSTAFGQLDSLCHHKSPSGRQHLNPTGA